MKPSSGPRTGIDFFFATLVVVGILRVLVGHWTVPFSLLPIVNVPLAALFLGGPLLALCFAARDHWTPKTALQFFIGGLVVHILCVVLLHQVFQLDGIPAQTLNAVAQVALPVWCVGLGALLATLIKDQNIVVPIAIFLACLDMFLVFSPLGVTHVLIQKVPALLPQMAAQIPSVAHNTPSQKVTAGALAGPADFMFLAMFLIALFRFELKAKETVRVVIPTLLLYMTLVSIIRTPLPALLPIGLVVLIVNWKEFRLSKDEQIATAFVSVLGLGLFTWGMFQKPLVKLAEPSKQPDAQASPRPSSSRATTDEDPRA